MQKDRNAHIFINIFGTCIKSLCLASELRRAVLEFHAAAPGNRQSPLLPVSYLRGTALAPSNFHPFPLQSFVFQMHVLSVDDGTEHMVLYGKRLQILPCAFILSVIYKSFVFKSRKPGRWIGIYCQ